MRQLSRMQAQAGCLRLMRIELVMWCLNRLHGCPRELRWERDLSRSGLLETAHDRDVARTHVNQQSGPMGPSWHGVQQGLRYQRQWQQLLSSHHSYSLDGSIGSEAHRSNDISQVRKQPHITDSGPAEFRPPTLRTKKTSVMPDEACNRTGASTAQANASACRRNWSLESGITTA